MTTTETLIGYKLLKSQYFGNDRLMNLIDTLESALIITDKRLYRMVYKEYLRHKCIYDLKFNRPGLLMIKTIVDLANRANPKLTMPAGYINDCSLIRPSDISMLKYPEYPMVDSFELLEKIKPYIKYKGDWLEFRSNLIDSNKLAFYASWKEMLHPNLKEDWILQSWIRLVQLGKELDTTQVIRNIILRHYNYEENHINF